MAVARNQGVIFHAKARPQDFPFVSVNAVDEIKQKGGTILGGVGIAVKARVGVCAELRQNARTFQLHAVIAWLSGLCFLVNSFEVARSGILPISWAKGFSFLHRKQRKIP